MLKGLINKFNNNKIVKAGFWYTIGNFLLKGISFLTVPIFTRVLTTSDYGLFNTYMAYESMISIIIGLGLAATVKNAKYEYKEDLENYLSSVVFMSFVIFILLLITGNLFFETIKYYFGFNKLILNILISNSYAVFLISLISSKYIINFEYKKFLKISFFNISISVFLSLILILYFFEFDKYIGRIIGHAIPPIIIGIYILISLRNKSLINTKYWKFGLVMGLPLVIHQLSHVILSQFDRIMIQKYIGSSEAGIYSFSYNIGLILAVILSSLDSVYTPWFYDKMNKLEYKIIKEKSRYYCIVFSMLTIGLITVSPEIIKILAPKEYWNGIDLVIPIVLSVFFTFLYYFPSCVQYFYKKTVYIAIGTGFASLSNIALNIVFIPIYGYTAAAYTTLISYVLLFIFHWFIAKRLKDNLFDIKFIIINIVIVSIVAVIMIKLKEFVIIRYAFVLLNIFVVFINYKKILVIIKGLKDK